MQGAQARASARSSAIARRAPTEVRDVMTTRSPALSEHAISAQSPKDWQHRESTPCTYTQAPQGALHNTGSHTDALAHSLRPIAHISHIGVRQCR